MAEEQNEEMAAGKTKEQLEAEKKAALSQRIVPLNLSGLDTAALLVKVKELHDKLFRLEGEKYDMTTRAKRQQEDVQELSERARQMTKTKGNQRKADGEDELHSKYTNAPRKIAVCSKYDRQTDKRSYKQRMALFNEEGQEISDSAQPPQEAPPSEE